MKVKDLITRLMEFDSEMDVHITDETNLAFYPADNLNFTVQENMTKQKYLDIGINLENMEEGLDFIPNLC